MSSKSYFNKVVLLLLLSIAAFGGLKAVLPERLFPERVLTAKGMIMDSMLIDAINESEMEDAVVSVLPDVDTIQVVTKTDSLQTTDIVGDNNLNPLIADEGYVHLSRFYNKLLQIEENGNGRARVAYFGDSMNDGDLIVQDIRDYLQNKFGGKGVGFVGMTSLSAGARYSVAHQYSKNWQIYSFITTRKPVRPFGIDGQVTLAKDSANTYWVKYESHKLKNTGYLYNATLFYGRSDNADASVSVKVKDDVTEKALNASDMLNAVKLAGSDAQSLQITFSNADSIPFYGLNFDDGRGVHVDNFSLRGNSGLPLSTLNNGLMNRFNNMLGGYDLIVLHYGANVLSQETKSYNWYEKGMTRVVENLRRCFPDADILVISTADKASKIDQEMVTDPAVSLLLNAQRNYARKMGAGFVNLYSLMGGEGSMVEWVDDELAGKDYTHFNANGSKRIAKLIYGEMEKGYQKFKENIPQHNNITLDDDEDNNQ